MADERERCKPPDPVQSQAVIVITQLDARIDVRAFYQNDNSAAARVANEMLAAFDPTKHFAVSIKKLLNIGGPQP